MPRTFNPQVEAVIAESTQPVLVRELIIALDEGQLSEDKQRAAMALLQSYGVDLFDLGLSFLSDKTADEIHHIAEQAEE
jgi:hypothetical protein